MNDQKNILKLYSKSVINEMNLGTNADTNVGLGAPAVVGVHTPQEYHEAVPCCGKCGKCTEDNEEYHDDRGCCKHCNHCPHPEDNEENLDNENIFETSIEVSISDSKHGFTSEFNDYRVKGVLRFKLHVDFVKWGIESIHVFPLGATITVEGVIWGDVRDHEETFTSNIDASQIKVHFEKHSRGSLNSVYPKYMHLYLLDGEPRRLNVDYERSFITVVS